LSAVTGLPLLSVSSMVGRQLPLFAFSLPFFAIVLFSGFRGLRTAWPAALVAGGSFALTQFAVSNFLGPDLPDVLSALVSLTCLIAFVQVWKPRDVEQYRATFIEVKTGIINVPASEEEGIPAPRPTGLALGGGKPTTSEAVLAWLPWLMVAAVVIVWTYGKVALFGQQNIKWPGLHNAIFLTLYNKPYAAVYVFQPLSTGTAILLAVVLTAIVLRVTPKLFGLALADTMSF